MSRTPGTPLGVRALGSLTRLSPVFSVARMDERTLQRVQTTELPDGWLVDAVIGRPRRDVRIRPWRFAGPGGQVPVRVYTPTGPPTAPRPLILALHGGGFSLGSARQGDWLHSAVASEVGAVVVAPDYRLAPAHPYPAAVDDAWAALEWAVANAGEWAADAERLAVMGDSAGGTLAAVVALQARDAGGPRLRHQVLIYPATDLTDEALPGSEVDDAPPPVLSNADLRVFRELYVPPGEDLTHWRLSPARAADLAGLPSATLVLAGRDPLHSSGAAYAQALADAGVDVWVEEFARMPHGFLTFPYLCRREARAGLAAVVRDLRDALLD